jgi:hypothetical protein
VALWYRFTRPDIHAAARPAESARPAPVQTAPVTPRATRTMDVPAAPAVAPPEARDAAMRAIHHHISAVGGGSLARPEDVRRIAAEHGVTLPQLRREAAAMYGAFQRHYAPHGALSPEAAWEMDALARLLELPAGPGASVR